jgi:hypothetical protein
LNLDCHHLARFEKHESSFRRLFVGSNLGLPIQIGHPGLIESEPAPDLGGYEWGGYTPNSAEKRPFRAKKRLPGLNSCFPEVKAGFPERPFGFPECSLGFSSLGLSLPGQDLLSPSLFSGGLMAVDLCPRKVFPLPPGCKSPP